MSVKINRRTIERSSTALSKLEGLVQELVHTIFLNPNHMHGLYSINEIFLFRLKEDDSARLNEEYQNMLKGLREANEARESDLILANPVLPDDILKGTLFSLSIRLCYTTIASIF